MMEHLLVLIAFALFALHIGRVTLLEVFVWQLKEYRLDRIFAFFATEQGKKFIVNPFVLVKSVLLISSLIFYSYLGQKFILFLYLTINLLENMFVVWKGTKSFRIPVFTVKAVITTCLSVGIALMLVILTSIDKSVFLQLVERLLPVIILLVVLSVNAIGYFVKKIIIALAKNRIAGQENLIPVGITGSYGKTSTKYFLSTILSGKHRLVNTAGSHNTEMGVAMTAIRKLASDTEIFIAEMGAYKKGEIETICKMVGPKIGIITGINEQHVGLFGSIEQTMRTKYELIKNLTYGGVAVFNLRNQYVREMVRWTAMERKDLTMWGYQRLDQGEKPLVIKRSGIKMVYAKHVKSKKDTLSFILVYGGREASCHCQLLGVQNVDNILAAVAVALQLGLSPTEIAKAIAVLRSPENTMRFIKFSKDSYFIDDTFNANPDGIRAVLEYMQSQDLKRKILVLTPLIELGGYAEKIHRELGRKAVKVCDLIIITNDNYYRSFVQGAEETGKTKGKIFIAEMTDSVSMIKSFLKEGAIASFEGKEAKKILNQITNTDIC